MISITDIEDERIRPYFTLRARQEFALREEGGLFVAESEKVVRSLLESGLEVVSLLAEPAYYERLTVDRVPEEGRFTASKELLDRVVGMRLHQGVMAVGKRPAPLQVVEEGPVVALDGLANAENVGAIARSCAAFGAKALIVDAGSSDPYLRRSVRVSMGGIFHVPVLYCDDLAACLKGLKGFTVVGTGLGPECKPLGQLPARSVLVIGAEGEGMRKEVKEVCDLLVTIPISDKVESLNAAVAASVLLYQVSSHSV